MIHLFADRDTVFEGLSLTHEFQLLDSQTTGYRSNDTGRDRVATVLSHFDSSLNFKEACRDSVNWTKPNRK